MPIFKKNNVKKQAQEKTGERYTIMVVDDEPNILKELEGLLANDYDIIKANDGQEALDIIHGMENPDKISLIICDQRMPNLTGVDFFEYLVDEKIIPEAIRIILTGYLEIPVIIDAINKANIYQFILKPFNPLDLTLTIKRAIETYQLKKEMNRFIDPVTRLGNKEYLKEFIGRDIEMIRKDYESWPKDRENTLPPRSNLAFLLLDLDDFKLSPTVQGRQSIDDTLHKFGEVLKKNCQQSDIAIRWEREKLMIVCRFIESREANKIAEKLHRVIINHRSELENEREIPITCSIGFACYPFIPGCPQVIEWSEVIEIADKALAAARKTGHSGYVGIMATENTRSENLMERIRKNLKELLDKRVLEAFHSLPDDVSLAWE